MKISTLVGQATLGLGLLHVVALPLRAQERWMAVEPTAQISSMNVGLRQDAVQMAGHDFNLLRFEFPACKDRDFVVDTERLLTDPSRIPVFAFPFAAPTVTDSLREGQYIASDHGSEICLFTLQSRAGQDRYFPWAGRPGSEVSLAIVATSKAD